MTTFDFGSGNVPAHRHVNGGGWVADTAKVTETSFVGPNARVFDNADIIGNSKISGNAQVFENAWVNSGKIFGNAKVFGNTEISVGAQVFENAEVSGLTGLYGHAKVYGYTKISDDVMIFGDKTCPVTGIIEELRCFAKNKDITDINFLPVGEKLNKIADELENLSIRYHTSKENT